MSAHCDDCGYDLPYDLNCRCCATTTRLEKAREALRYVAEDAATLAAAKTTAEAGLRLSLPDGSESR